MSTRKRKQEEEEELVSLPDDDGEEEEECSELACACIDGLAIPGGLTLLRLCAQLMTRASGYGS
ncbi:hypothetical protein LX36DRAFT_658907 [Colletotrichum falcatum]|nr:hypothetical protein LX36DRAFT_658907 [Colletotrichum falcatum]